jgi:hypothetical protein
MQSENGYLFTPCSFPPLPTLRIASAPLLGINAGGFFDMTTEDAFEVCKEGCNATKGTCHQTLSLCLFSCLIAFSSLTTYSPFYRNVYF